MAVFISPSYSREEISAAVQYGKLALGTENISGFTRNCSTGLEKVFGQNTSTNSLDELVAADVILALGSFNNSQIAAVKIRNAVKASAQLLTIKAVSAHYDKKWIDSGNIVMYIYSIVYKIWGRNII